MMSAFSYESSNPCKRWNILFGNLLGNYHISVANIGPIRLLPDNAHWSATYPHVHGMTHNKGHTRWFFNNSRLSTLTYHLFNTRNNHTTQECLPVQTT